MSEDQLWSEIAQWDEGTGWDESAPWEDGEAPPALTDPVLGVLQSTIVPFDLSANVLDEAHEATFANTTDYTESSMSNDFITGDSRSKLVQLNINADSFEIPAGSKVTAQIVSKTKNKVLTSAPAESLITRPGANWSTSLVAVKFPRAATADIKVSGASMPALLEIQVTLDPENDPEDLTFYTPITLVKGNLV